MRSDDVDESTMRTAIDTALEEIRARMKILTDGAFMCYHGDMNNTQHIPNYPAYRLRSDGILETNWRTGAHYPGMPCSDQWRPLYKKPNPDGYIPVCLRRVDGPERRTHIHRLMAELFIGTAPFPNACVRHLDGNSLNNAISNLAWGTYQENEDDKRHHGTYALRISNGKLTPATMEIARTMGAQGITHRQIAATIGVSRPTISRLLKGVTWQ